MLHFNGNSFKNILARSYFTFRGLECQENRLALKLPIAIGKYGLFCDNFSNVDSKYSDLWALNCLLHSGMFNFEVYLNHPD